MCRADCTFDEVPTCQPISCGFFEIPANSLARKRLANGTLANALHAPNATFSTMVELFYNEAVLIECNAGHILANDGGLCEFQTEVVCHASGELSSMEEQCSFQPCNVYCEVGTAYGGPSGTDNGCANGACPASAPRVYISPDMCPEEASSRCEEFRSCTPISCGQYPIPANSVVSDPNLHLFGSIINVTCNDRFVPESFVPDISSALIANPSQPNGLQFEAPAITTFEAVCQNNGSWTTQHCLSDICAFVDEMFFSCGPFAPRMIESSIWVVEDVISPQGYIAMGESATITCPPGSRIGSTNVDAPSVATSMCRADCTFDEVPTCQPISCGFFEIPANSLARKRLANGTLANALHAPNATFSTMVELFYNEAVLIECNAGHILANDGGLCEFQTEVVCHASGELSSMEEQCSFQPCNVYCEVGTAYGGPSGTDNGCANGACPDSAPRVYDSPDMCPEGASSRCEEKFRSCTPLSCGQLAIPDNATADCKNVADGSATDCSTPGAELLYNGVATVTCNAGFVTEDSVPLAGQNRSGSRTYSSTCQNNGFLTQMQDCLSDSCIVVNEGFSCGHFEPRPVEHMAFDFEEVWPQEYVVMGDAVEITCPEGSRVGSSDPLSPSSTTARCLETCNFEDVPTCQPISCGFFQIPANSTARVRRPNGNLVYVPFGRTEVEVFFGEGLSVHCNHTYAFENTSLEECAFKAEVLCMASGFFNESGFADCVVHECRQDIECTWNGANQMTPGNVSWVEPSDELEASYAGSITLRCAEGYITTEGGQEACQKEFVPTCQRDGTFSLQDEAQCEPVFCPPLSTVVPFAESSSNLLTWVPYNTSIVVSCAENYGANGVPGATFTAVCGKEDAPELSCQWDLPALCERISCGQVPLSTYAKIRENPDSTSMSLLSGEEVHVECNFGFRISNSNNCSRIYSVACLSTGEFDRDLTGMHCVPVRCPPFSDLLNSSTCSSAALARFPGATPDAETGYGDQVNLFCDTDGQAQVIECQADCTLETHSITCQPSICEPFEVFNITGRPSRRVHGRSPPTTPQGAKVTIECEEGFELVREEEYEGQPSGRMTVTLWKPSAAAVDPGQC